MELQKMKKSELIKRCEDLQAELEDVKQQLDDLDDCYGELENEFNQKEDLNPDEIKSEQAAKTIEKLLQELRFNNELQDNIFKTIIKYLDEWGYRFEALDEPQDIETIKPSNAIRDRLYKVLETYLKNFEDWDSQ
jgi:DNA repair exonuclease SbcCD ATPase subunit